MQNQKWYVNNYRRNLVDMHIDAWNEEFLSNFDPDVYFHCLQMAHINGPMIYTHSHVGYTNWPSKSGQMHPGFRGERKVERLFELCNNAGMDVIAYYSLIYNNWAYDMHPSWRMRDINGMYSRSYSKSDDRDLMMLGKGRYGIVCPNNAEYRAFLKLQFTELAEHFTFKGIFLDMTFWPMICYCGSCKARFKEEAGHNLPDTVDWSSPEWLLFQKKREEWMTEFAFYATTEMKKAYPGVDVEHQYSTAPYSWTFGVVSGQSGASDYVGGDLYGSFEQQSLICKLYYGLSKNQPFEYMTSRCDPGLFDHTTTKSLEALKLHAYLTYAHHGAFLAIDAIDPRGTLNEKFYNTLGQAFAETEPYETYYKGALSADIALYFSFLSKMNYRGDQKRRASASASTSAGYHHLDCILGAAKALHRAHLPYRVVSDNDLGSLDRSKAIVLSDIAFMTFEEEDALYAFVQNGGGLYISGITSKNLVKRLLNLEITGQTQENITYMRPTERGLPYFEGMYDKTYPLTVFGTQELTANTGGHTVLATVTLPYTDPQDLTVLASIHSNPPGINTENPAIVYGQCGKGLVIWSSAPFESSEQPVHKRVFVNLLGLLAPQPLVRSDAPPQIEFTVFEEQDSSVMQLHCVNVQEEFPLIRMPGFRASVRVPRPVKSLTRLPDGVGIDFEEKDGYLSFDVGPVDIFAMFEIGF